MPVLPNAKYELFAQAIASGQTLEKAYAAAGYKPSKSNGSTLRSKQNVSERIKEILEQASDKLVKNIDCSREKILAEIEQARLMAIDLEMPGAAWQASMAKAKIRGLIIDRREVGEAGAYDALTDDELVALAAKKARELGLAGPRLVEDGSKIRPDDAKS